MAALVSGHRYIYSYAKYETPSNDTVYTQILFYADLAVNKEIGLSVVNELFSNIPADLSSFKESHLKEYKDELAGQIELVKKVGARDTKIEQLEHYTSYQKLVDYINSL